MSAGPLTQGHARPPRLRDTLGTGGLAAGLVPGDRRILPAAALLAHGFAWVGHFAFEGDRPATFEQPLWSLLSDLAMLGPALSGRLGGELRRHLPEDG